MNCCCDPDCSLADKELFSECNNNTGFLEEQSSARRQRSCYQSFTFFKHHESKRVVKTDKGLLCIVRDNNIEDNILSTSQIDEVREKILNGKLSMIGKYSWVKRSENRSKLEAYRYSSPILGVKVGNTKQKLESVDVFNLALPNSFHTSPCSVQEPVRFLHNIQTHCKIKFSDLSKDCTQLKALDSNSLVDAMLIIANPGDKDPQLMSIVKGKVCSNGLCYPESEDDISPVEFSAPELKQRNRTCTNVLKSLKLNVFHEGIDGLFEIVAEAHLEDLPLNNTELVQEFNVKFFWSTANGENSTNATKVASEDYPRSGNPGYIVGKPVIMGEKVKVYNNILSNETKVDEDSISTNGRKEDTVEEMVLVWGDPSKWMTIPSPGTCLQTSPTASSRLPVAFDFGHSSSCILDISKFKYCEDLQIEVGQIILGTDDPERFDKRPWFVAAYGSSNPEVPSEWVPLTFKNFPIISTSKGSSKSLVSQGCQGLVNSMHISIAYAFVGSVDFPQARITGVLYELGEPISTFPLTNNTCVNKCQTRRTHLRVSATVTFKDVTTPAITRVAKWPVVSIKLPADFFYPFSSPSSSMGGSFSNLDYVVLFASFLCSLVM